MSNCCHKEEEKADSCHSGGKKRFDYILWFSIFIIVPFYILELVSGSSLDDGNFGLFSHSVFELMNKMWWGLALGIFFVGILSKVPREFVLSILGEGGRLSGILRATMAGVLLDLCSHGVLLIGMKLYERGASLGQVMAFLIASPWNSFSLTVILWSLVGFKWMMTFLLISMVIAVISGLIFEFLVKKGVLPENANKTNMPEGFKFFEQAKKNLAKTDFNLGFFMSMLKSAMLDSRMILKWIFFGVVLASLIRTFMSSDDFSTFFGPTLIGLGSTLIFATIMEVCSEGSVPVAADILNRANAPGNSFAFLMTGVSTDYTEIMSIKETTRSWKIAFFLPLVTIPQIVMVAIIINMM